MERRDPTNDEDVPPAAGRIGQGDNVAPTDDLLGRPPRPGTESGTTRRTGTDPAREVVTDAGPTS